MFVFLYQPQGGVGPKHLEAVGPRGAARPHTWISPDGIAAAAWTRPVEQTVAPAPGDGRMVLAGGRFDEPGEGPGFGERILRSGEGALAAAAGDYAALEWDPAHRALWLGTDPFGTVPVYYARSPQGLFAATALPDLLSLPGAPTTLDGDSLTLLMMRELRIGENHTPFASVKRLVGGHSVRLRIDAEPRERRWWRPEEGELVRHRNPRDYTAALRTLFRSAVRARLPESGPVCGTLSGGLDSTLVMGYAAAALAEEGRELRAYTSVPHAGVPIQERPGWDPSDWEYAGQLVAAHGNIRHEAVSPEGVCPLAITGEIAERGAVPVRNGTNHIWMLGIARRAQALGAGVVLTGERGNATISFAGEGGLARLLRGGRLTPLWQHLRAMPGGRSRRLARTVAEAMAGDEWTVRLLRWGGIAQSASRLPMIRPEVRARFRALLPPHGQALGRRANRVRFALRPLGPFVADWRVMANVEFRDPTADRRLVEYLLRCPPEAFVAEGLDRVQARWLGAGVVPDAIRYRRTRGEQCPEEPALIGLYASRYRELWSRVRRHPWIREAVDLPVADRILDALIAGSGTRPEAFEMHLILNVGQFLEVAERRWQGSAILHPAAAYAGGRR